MESPVSVAWKLTLYVTNFRDGMDDVQMRDTFNRVSQVASQSSFSDRFRFSVWYNPRRSNESNPPEGSATFNTRLQLVLLLIFMGHMSRTSYISELNCRDSPPTSTTDIDATTRLAVGIIAARGEDGSVVVCYVYLYLVSC
jgi:hypothetical protein